MNEGTEDTVPSTKAIPPVVHKCQCDFLAAL